MGSLISRLVLSRLVRLEERDSATSWNLELDVELEVLGLRAAETDGTQAFLARPAGLRHLTCAGWIGR